MHSNTLQQPEPEGKYLDNPYTKSGLPGRTRRCMDQMTGGRKLFDIIIKTPVNILSVSIASNILPFQLA